jgi:hypothetical protein
MSVDAVTTERFRQENHAAEERLPPLTAGFAIVGLSLLCWVPLLLPLVAFLHR